MVDYKPSAKLQPKSHEVATKISRPSIKKSPPKKVVVTKSKVDLNWKNPSEYHNNFASYAFTKCNATAKNRSITLPEKYSCENQVVTRNSEN
jgi:hypothetical protein